MVVSFPEDVAYKMTAHMLGEPAGSILPEEDMYDCIGEIANILVGNLLPLLDDANNPNISLPSVVIGHHKVIWRRKDTPYDLLTYECDLGCFAAGINMRNPGQETGEIRKGFKFLLVDDSRVMRRMLQRVLKETEVVGDCSFIEAGDGESALLELEKNDYSVDAVFCDVCMPHMDGIAFLEALGERDKLESCPVIIVTGDASDGREKEALALGARSCITKPFTAERIGSALKNALNM